MQKIARRSRRVTTQPIDLGATRHVAPDLHTVQNVVRLGTEGALWGSNDAGRYSLICAASLVSGVKVPGRRRTAEPQICGLTCWS